MNKITDTELKIIELLGKQNATPEEKKVQALIKAALLVDSLTKFIQEVYAACNGFGKVSTDTVKGTVEYFRAHNEAQIRSLSISDKDKENMVASENIRLTEVEVWILGSLAYWRLLQ